MNAFRHISLLRGLRKSQWSARPELEQIQWRRFQRVIRHAYATVPYYTRLFDDVGITPDDIHTREDVSLIPITTKEALQALPLEERLMRGVDRAQCIERRTSGSTGRPFTIILSRDEKEGQDIVQARAMLENGMRLTDRRVVFVAPWQIPKRRYWFQQFGVWRKTYLSVFDDIRDQFSAIERANPHCFSGTPAVLRLLAYEQRERKSPHVAPRTLFSAADLLDQSTRQLLTSVFDVEVIDLYGSLEFGYIAWECERHAGYHINVEQILLEVCDDGTPVSDGEIGDAICTSLHSYTMPLIRYRLGDLCALDSRSCPCGRTLPLMKLIAGRANDAVTLPNGRMLTPQALADSMVEFGEIIQQFRIVQERTNYIRIELVKGPRFNDETLAAIRTMLRGLLGDDIEVQTELVECIDPDPSGKQKAIVSHVHSS